MRLNINDRYSEFYLLVENIDQQFISSHFSDAEGTLYKELWPSMHPEMGWLTTEKIIKQRRTNKKSGAQFESIFTFAKQLQSNGDQQAAAIQEWWSIDHLARFMAVDRATANNDGPMHFYCGKYMGKHYCSNHNYFLYHEASQDRMWLIPWDMDNSFALIEGTTEEHGLGASLFVSINYSWDDPNAPCKAAPGRIKEDWAPWQMPPSCDPFVNGLGCHFHEHYQSQLRNLIEGPFSEQIIDQKLQEWTALIADAQAEAHRNNPELLSRGLEKRSGRAETSNRRAANPSRAKMRSELTGVQDRGLIASTNVPRHYGCSQTQIAREHVAFAQCSNQLPRPNAPIKN